LKSIAARYPEARDLQQAWLMPEVRPARGGLPGAAPNSRVPAVTVTLPSGEKAQGRLVRIDDFIVTIELPDGTSRSFSRHGDSPKVDVTDPLKPHRDLLRQYTDTEIHNITAYLVTIK
jgi:cytochrome c oxidase cbb3-type subunit 3